MISLLMLLLSLSFYPLYNKTADTVVQVQPYCAPTIGIYGVEVRLPWSYRYASGAGVFISADGKILTARHIADSSGIFRITTKKGRVLRARVLCRDEGVDLAILQPLNVLDTFSYAALGWEPRIGDVVACIGHPGKLLWNFTVGVVTKYQDEYIISDVVANPGSSGGGLYSLSGKLVGITSGITGPLPFGSYQGHSLFVRTSYLRKFVRRYTQ